MIKLVYITKAVGLIFLALAYYLKSTDRGISIAAAIIGFIIYLGSMVLMFIARRKKKQQDQLAAESDKTE